MDGTTGVGGSRQVENNYGQSQATQGSTSEVRGRSNTGIEASTAQPAGGEISQEKKSGVKRAFQFMAEAFKGLGAGACRALSNFKFSDIKLSNPFKSKSQDPNESRISESAERYGGPEETPHSSQPAVKASQERPVTTAELEKPSAEEPKHYDAQKIIDNALKTERGRDKLIHLCEKRDASTTSSFLIALNTLKTVEPRERYVKAEAVKELIKTNPGLTQGVRETGFLNQSKIDGLVTATPIVFTKEENFYKFTGNCGLIAMDLTTKLALTNDELEQLAQES